MKVLIVNPVFYTYGGAERLIVKLCNYLTERGVSTSVLTQVMLPHIKEEFTETRLIETGNMEALIPVAHSILHKFDVVNPHNDPAQITIFPRKYPSVWMCNEPPSKVLLGGELSGQERDIVRRHIDISVVSDEFNRERFEDIYGVSPRVNHYGVDYPFFSEGDASRVKEKYGMSDTFTVMQVCMFTPTKNQMRTVNIFKKLKKRVPDAKLILVGFNSTPYHDTVKRFIAQSRLTKDVTITGEIPQEDIRDLYHAVDAVVAPIQSQGGWLSTFEAIASGTPVLVSSDMTASYLLEEHGLGLVTDTFVDELVDIYEHPRGNVKGRKWVEENLSWEKFCGNMLGYFEEVSQ